MKLSLIIPQYSEEETVIFPLLSSIDNQVGIDFKDIEVLVLNDCSNVILSDEFLNQFVNITPQYIRLKKNVGLGMCRQAGIETAEGEYLMFCDADDRFLSCTALYLYFQLIANTRPDFITSRWLEELKGNGRVGFVKHDTDATWVHGKMYRRQFLIDKDIKHHPLLRVHEDSYFNGLVLSLSSKTMHLQAETYLWCWNERSITRANNSSFFVDEMRTFIFSVSEMCKELGRRGREADLPLKVAGFLLHMYFSLYDKRFDVPEYADIKRGCISDLRNFYFEFGGYLSDVNKEEFDKLLNIKKQRFLGTVETSTFPDFIELLKS